MGSSAGDVGLRLVRLGVVAAFLAELSAFLGMGCFGPILETGLFGAFWKSDFGVRHRPDEPSRAKRGVGFGPARRRF